MRRLGEWCGGTVAEVVTDDSYDVVATLKDAQVDGIVVHNLAWIVRTLVEWHVPVVYVGLGEEPEDLPLDRVGAVTIDETAGLRAAAQHLLDQGHVHVGVITGPHHRPGPLPRLQGASTADCPGQGPWCNCLRTGA